MPTSFCGILTSLLPSFNYLSRTLVEFWAWIGYRMTAWFQLETTIASISGSSSLVM
jgi:hypothetical protein